MKRSERSNLLLTLPVACLLLATPSIQGEPTEQLSTRQTSQAEGQTPELTRVAGDGKYWWKGNLHTHTLWSDGDHFPEVVAQWYVDHGYHFLSLSDHNVLLRGERWINPETNRHIARNGGMAAVEEYRDRFGKDWVETRQDDDGNLEVRLKPLDEFRELFEQPGGFLLIEAQEITERSHTVHMNATNLSEFIEPLTGASVEETIRLNVDAVHAQSRKTGQPILPHLNHPNFRWAVTAEDMAPVERLNFFEVYNGHRGVHNFGDGLRIDLDRMWDIVLTKRLAELGLGVIYGLAVDDTHHYGNSSSQVARPGRGWVMVKSEELTAEDLLSAMRRGDFYASSGVELETIEATPDHLHVEVATNDGSDAAYTIQFIGTRKGYDPAREPITVPEKVGKIADITGRWIFVQAVADRDRNQQTLRIYDPQNDDWHEGTVSLPPGATRPTGALHIPSHPDLYPFKGNMTELRLWHAARSRTDAEHDMKQRLTGQERGLAGYWPVDGLGGGLLQDHAGNSNLILEQARHSGDAPVDGWGIVSTRGEGAGNVVDPQRLVPGSNSFSIEMWVQTDPDAQGWNLPFEWIGGDRVYVGHDVGAGWNFAVTTDGTRTDTQNGETENVVTIRTTHRYSADIGEVLQETTAPRATYHFTGDEIYVRARIISSELHPSPFTPGERQKAWVQPAIPGIGLVEVQQYE